MRVLELGGRVEAPSAIPWGLIVNRERAAGLVQPSQVSEVLELPLLAVLPEDPHAGEDFSNLLGKEPRNLQYMVALERMARTPAPGSRSRPVQRRGLPSRCLRALRTLSGEPDEMMPGQVAFSPVKVTHARDDPPTPGPIRPGSYQAAHPG